MAKTRQGGAKRAVAPGRTDVTILRCICRHGGRGSAQANVARGTLGACEALGIRAIIAGRTSLTGRFNVSQIDQRRVCDIGANVAQRTWDRIRGLQWAICS